jgi:hypothetical protein
LSYGKSIVSIRCKEHYTLKNRLKTYKQSFGEDTVPTFEDVYTYFKEQFICLINQETIDRLVVDLANSEYQKSITSGELQEGSKGEALFEPITPKSYKESVSFAKTKPNFEDTNTTPVSFVPQVINSSECAELREETFLYDAKLIKPNPTKGAMINFHVINADEFSKKYHNEEPWEKAIISSEMLHTDEPLKNSRLYQFWTSPSSREDKVRLLTNGAIEKSFLT